MLVSGRYGRLSTPNDPHLDTEDAELLAFIAEPLVSKRQRCRADALLKTIVEPQAVLAVASTDTKEMRVAQHVGIVYAAVGKGFEPDGGRAGDGKVGIAARSGL